MGTAASILETLPSRLRARWRWFAAAAALLLAWGLAGFLLAPVLLRSSLESFARDQLHRPLRVGSIRFNPFSVTLEVRDLELLRARDAGPLLSFRLLRVNAEPVASLLHRAWTLKELRLEQPHVEAFIDEQGELNLAHLLPPGPPEPQPAAPAAPPRVRVGTLAIIDGHASLDDRSGDRRVQLKLAPIEFTLHDFRTASGHENAYRLEAESSAGERFAWSGEFTVQPLGSSGTFEVGGLRAATIAQFLGDALPLTLAGGTLDLQGRYQAAYAKGLALKVELPRMAVRDLAMLPAGSSESEPWVQLPLLEVSGTSLSLADRNVRVGQVRLDGARVRAWRERDGSINLARLATPAPVAGPATAEAPSAPGLASPRPAASPATVAPSVPWAVAVDAIALSGAQVDFEDRTLSPAGALRLSPINANLQGYTLAGTQPVRFDLDVGLDGRGQLGAKGSGTLEPLAVDAGITVAGLALAQLQPWVRTATRVEVTDGQFRAQGHAGFRAGKGKAAPALAFTGALGVDRLATRDALAHENLVAWKQLDVGGIDYRSSPARLRIDTVRVRGADARVVIADNGTLNLSRALAAPGAPTGDAAKDAAPDSGGEEGADEGAGAGATTEPAPAAGVAATAGEAPAPAARTAAARSMPVSISRVLLEDGNVDFNDHSVQPEFSAAIVGLAGSIDGLSSDPASRAKVALKGSVDRYAPVEITGEVNPLAATAYSDIAMHFSNIELTTFNPYSGKFAGYNIAKGKLSTDLRYHVEKRRLQAQHHVVIDQMEFGAATNSKDAVPLPVKLAVALLKDRNGVIDLELPVTGSLDDPKFRIAPIVWKLLRGLVRKVVTAPFALLGSLFGGGPDLQFVPFAPGSALLDDAGRARLAQLVKALGERPQLKLDVPLQTLCAEDARALDDAAYEAAVAAAIPAAAGKPQPSRAALLAVLYQQQFGSRPQYPPEVAGAGKEAAAPGAAQGAAQGAVTSREAVAAAQQAWLEAQLKPRFKADAAARDALARARAEAVRDAVVADGRIDAGRVFLTARSSGAGQPGTARMELQLQ